MVNVGEDVARWEHALLVVLWIDPTMLEGNLELCTTGYKRPFALQPSHTSDGFIHKRDHR